jgi:hypothetical protein
MVKGFISVSKTFYMTKKADFDGESMEQMLLVALTLAQARTRNLVDHQNQSLSAAAFPGIEWDRRTNVSVKKARRRFTHATLRRARL